jgi:hypothetical protein
MNASSQHEALAMLAEVWSLSPDVRLGQLCAHLGFLGEDRFGRGLWDIDDDELMSILSLHKGELLARLQNMPDLTSQVGGGAASVRSPTPSSGSPEG